MKTYKDMQCNINTFYPHGAAKRIKRFPRIEAGTGRSSRKLKSLWETYIEQRQRPSRDTTQTCKLHYYIHTGGAARMGVTDSGRGSADGGSGSERLDGK